MEYVYFITIRGLLPDQVGLHFLYDEEIGGNK